MSKFKRRLGALLYYTIAKHLPVSYSSVRIGQTALRRFCGRLMLESCGKKVNIEKNAVFSAKVSLGSRSGIGINARINGRCVIGDDVMMGTDCVIITRNHRHDRTDIPMMDQGFEEERPVFIGNDVRRGQGHHPPRGSYRGRLYNRRRLRRHEGYSAVFRCGRNSR